MSHAFITRRGGETMGKRYASIFVSFPQGSVCVCSDGDKILRAKDTDGAWMFAIPHEGTWTLACTDGDRTATKEVEISGRYQSESVTLRYELILYMAGDECTELTGGWMIASNGGHVNYAQKKEDHLYVGHKAENDGTFGGRFRTNNAIDLTAYSRLCCYATADRNYNRINGTVGILTSGTTDIYSRTAQAYTSGAESQLIRADISQLGGEHYIFFTAGTAISSYGCADKIWLEP